MILHMLTKAEWDAAPAEKPYIPADFAKDGFIHCTHGVPELLAVGNRFYKTIHGDFVVLHIDEAKVHAPVKWEGAIHPKGGDGAPEAGSVVPDRGPQSAPAQESGPLFPHIYGPLNRDAIVSVRGLLRNSDGAFVGYAQMEAGQATARDASNPLNPLNLRKPSELAQELLEATDGVSDAMKRLRERIEQRMSEIDEKMKRL